MRKNVELYHQLDDRAKEYVCWMDGEIWSDFDKGVYLKLRNGKMKFLGKDLYNANKTLLVLNPYEIWLDGDQDYKPCIQTFNTFEEMKMWAHLTSAIAILEKSDEPTFYWNYAYSVNERGGYFND